MSRFLLLVLLLLPLSSMGQAIYRTTDAQGNVVFTDTPPDGATSAERVEIRPTNTARPTEIPPRPEPDTSDSDSEGAPYTLSITEPANETTIPMGAGDFSVSVNVSPALQSTDRLQLFVDGAREGLPQRAPTWNLSNVYRGQHDLTVAAVNDAGKTLASSPAVRVFVMRPSVNSPQSPNAPPKPVKPLPKPQPPRPQPLSN